MKKTLAIPVALFCLVLTAGCEGTEKQAGGTQNSFAGHYRPSIPVMQMQHDLHEEGVEASIDSVTVTDLWTWDDGRRLKRIDYDIERSNNTHAIHDDYYYDRNGRIDSLRHVVEGVAYPERTFRFYYTNGLLSRIQFHFGEENLTRTTEFRYHAGDNYPYAILFIHPLNEWLTDFYHTDTLVQSWTLEWNDGNLTRAIADSTAFYCTGLTHIDYFYDNHYNPLQGFFSGDLISQDAFLDEPGSLCRNNMVRRVLHRLDAQGNPSTSEDPFNFTYRSNDGYPVSMSSSYESLYWTILHVTTRFHYGEFVHQE